MGSLSTGADAPSDGLLAQISGLTEKTIGRGRRELGDSPDRPLWPRRTARGFYNEMEDGVGIWPVL